MTTTSLLSGLKVLVVEDDPIIALDVAATLESAGAIVVGPCHTVVEALAHIEREPFDVAVLDFRLETETAKAVADRLLHDCRPFLFHSSSRYEPEAAYPHVGIIDKPTRPDQLIAAVKALTRIAE